MRTPPLDVGHQWIPAPNRPTKVSINSIFSFRITHSPAGSAPLSCIRGALTGSSCSSPTVSVLSNADCAFRILLVLPLHHAYRLCLSVRTGDFVLTARTSTVEMVFRYIANGSIDGVPLYSNTSGIFVGRLPVPLPSSRWLESAQRASYVPIFGNIPDNEQSFTAPIELFIPIFQDKFVFDPDVSIVLLFDPQNSLPPEEADPARESTAVGVIVAAVVVPTVLIILGVTLFVAVIFPYAQEYRGAL